MKKSDTVGSFDFWSTNSYSVRNPNRFTMILAAFSFSPLAKPNTKFSFIEIPKKFVLLVAVNISVFYQQWRPEVIDKNARMA